MAQIRTRIRKTLPDDPVFRAGYDQGYLDVANAVLSFFEEKFIHNKERPEYDSEEYQKFLQYVKEINSALKTERNKAKSRVDSAN